MARLIARRSVLSGFAGVGAALVPGVGWGAPTRKPKPTPTPTPTPTADAYVDSYLNEY